MPVKVTKYRCSFRCGKTAMQSIKKAENHEAHCYRNPSNKTCHTCVNQIYKKDGDDFTSWYNRGCKIAKLEEFIERVYDYLQTENKLHVKPIANCPNWNIQIEVQGVDEYTEKLEKKLGEFNKAKLCSSQN